MLSLTHEQGYPSDDDEYKVHSMLSVTLEQGYPSDVD